MFVVDMNRMKQIIKFVYSRPTLKIRPNQRLFVMEQHTGTFSKLWKRKIITFNSVI